MTNDPPHRHTARLAELTREQITRWNAGDCVRVEDLLRQHTDLADDPAAVLDLIYSEVLLREDRGEQPSDTEYSARFPELSDSLQRQFQLHRALQLDSAGSPESQDIAAGSTQPGGLTGAPLPESAEAIDGFELLDVAGRGGTGVVYRARDRRLNRIVALKLIAGPDVCDPAQSQRILREAEAAARLRHPGIVQVFSTGEYRGTPCLVMEYFAGGTLARKLQDGVFESRDAAELMQRIADAVHHAHRQGVIHRDLKPGNILLDDDDNPHVSDFGLARRIDASQTLHATGDVVGTPAWMAPEQARGENIDHRADVYSLGAILYELLVGRPPFKAATHWEILRQVMTDDPVPPRALNPAVPVELDTICLHCLHKDADQRYGSASELAAELQRFLAGEPLRARPVSRLRRLGKWCRRNPAMAATSGLAATLLLAIGLGSVLYALQLAAAYETIKQQQQRALRAEQQARTDRAAAVDALHTLARSVFDDLTANAASIADRQPIVDAVMNGLDNLTQVAGDRTADRTALIARQRLADLLALSGRHEEAAERYQQAIALAESLLQTAPDDRVAHSDFVRAHSILALHHQQIGNHDDAVRHEQIARTHLDGMLERWPDDVSVRRYQVTLHQRRLDNLWTTATPSETLVWGRQALRDVSTLLQMSDNREDDLGLASSICQRVGRAAIDLYRPQLAADCFADARRHESALLDEFEDNEFHRLSRACIDRAAAAAAIMLGRPEEAEEQTARALAVFRDRADGDPRDLNRRRDLLDALRQHAASLTAAGRRQAAEEALREAIGIGDQLLQEAPGTAAFAASLADCHMKLADVCLRSGRWQDADGEITDARRVLQDLRNPSAAAMAELVHEPVKLLTGTIDPADSVSDDGRLLAACLIGLRDAQSSVSAQLTPESVAELQEAAGIEAATFDALLGQLQEAIPANPAVGVLVPVIRARILGLRARNLAESGEAPLQEQAPALLDHCLRLIERLQQQQPQLIPQLIAVEPDLLWVRATVEYQRRIANSAPGRTDAAESL